jgi:predicted ester cyclase
VPEASVRARLGWEADPSELRRIRRLWIRHSMAEDSRDLDGLIATLTPDCIYEVRPTGGRWEGHAGARAFYAELLGAFPDVHFDLVDIVIGPQGVIEVVDLSGTHRGPWAGRPPSGERAAFRLVIHFPWDPAARRFSGERIYFDTAELGAGSAGRAGGLTPSGA